MSTWLVTYSSSDEPYDIYLYRRWNKKAELFMSTRPELKKYTLNKQIGFDFRARDEMTIQAYLSLPPQVNSFEKQFHKFIRTSYLRGFPS